MEFSTFVSKKDIYASLIAWIKLSQKLSKSLIRLEKREESFIWIKSEPNKIRYKGTQNSEYVWLIQLVTGTKRYQKPLKTEQWR